MPLVDSTMPNRSKERGLNGGPFKYRLKMELWRPPSRLCNHFVLGIMVLFGDYIFVVKGIFAFISRVVTPLKALTKFQIIMLSRLDG